MGDNMSGKHQRGQEPFLGHRKSTGCSLNRMFFGHFKMVLHLFVVILNVFSPLLNHRKSSRKQKRRTIAWLLCHSIPVTLTPLPLEGWQLWLCASVSAGLQSWQCCARTVLAKEPAEAVSSTGQLPVNSQARIY